ncbi:MAG TPA: hypothetical protein VJK51_00005 [Candidatus Nanoarchaeia archaeon]|nr:hypothetical protein [Candidatus Nanoarchaeia archaeon]
MKLANNHVQLKEEVSALKFINKQTGYNLNVRNHIKDTYLVRGLLGELVDGASLICIGWSSLIGLVSGAEVTRTLGSSVYVLGGVVGAVVGSGFGVALQHLFLKHYDCSATRVQKALKYQKVYNTEGLQGLVEKNMPLDQF